MLGSRKNKNAIVWRIEGVKDIPPKLTMLINPSNLDLQYSQLINETRTMGGFVQEFWGEQLSGLSCSGVTSLFYNDKGLTVDFKQTESYKNFESLIKIYKNNGKSYSSKGSNRIVSFGKIVMTYFNKEYEGFFENFDYTESAEKPFSLDYSFSFKITKIIGDLSIVKFNYSREKI